MPAGVASGDLLVAGAGLDAVSTVTWPTGWTELFTELGPSNQIYGSCHYRVADGTEGSEMTLASNPVATMGAIVYRITGHNSAIEAGTATEGTSVNPDPPNLAPTWGAQDTLWFVFISADGSRAVSAAPASYGNLHIADVAGGPGCTHNAMRRELAAASDNPSIATIEGSEQWVANTIAIQPAETSATTTRSLQDSATPTDQHDYYQTYTLTVGGELITPSFTDGITSSRTESSDPGTVTQNVLNIFFPFVETLHADAPSRSVENTRTGSAEFGFTESLARARTRDEGVSDDFTFIDGLAAAVTVGDGWVRAGALTESPAIIGQTGADPAWTARTPTTEVWSGLSATGETWTGVTE
jgi:hypothetical protein